MGFKFFLSFLIIFLYGFSIAYSQNQDFKFSHLTINDGLSSNSVLSIYKDRQGFMWFGTVFGLNRYDGYNFKVFKHDYRDSTSIIDDYIEDLYEDHTGKLWVFTRVGANIYDPVRESFIRNTGDALNKMGVNESFINKIYADPNGNYFYLGQQNGLHFYHSEKDTIINFSHNSNDTLSISTNNIDDIVYASEDNYWVIHNNGILELFDLKQKKVKFRTDHIAQSVKSAIAEYRLFLDHEKDIWVYTTEKYGVFYLNTVSKAIKHIDAESSLPRLNTGIVSGIVQDEEDNLWIATDHGGVNLLDKESMSISYIQNEKENDKSLSNNSIISIFKDEGGIIWIGTFKKGVSYYHKNLIKFETLKNRVTDPESLPYDDVNAFEEDENENLWIGANGGGLIYYDRKNNSYKNYRYSTNGNSINNDVILDLYQDDDGVLWIGYFYGGLSKYDGRKFTHFKNDPNDSASLINDIVWDVFEDSRGNFWLGTGGGGVDLFHKETNTFEHFNTRQSGSHYIHSDYITSISEDESNRLWIGTAYGIEIRDQLTGEFRHILHDDNDPNSLSNNNINYVFTDSRNVVWIGTSEGLNVYNREKDEYKALRVEDGLPDNAIVGIEEDDQGNIWLITPNGISKLIINYISGDSLDYAIKNYDTSDGLQGKIFNVNAIMKTSDGHMWFGGPNGINYLQPENISINKRIPKVAFTNFQLFNTNVSVGEKVNNRIVLDQSITIKDHITLKHSEKIFSIEFAALSYFHPGKNKFEYKLEGFNENWVRADGRSRKAIYTNLDPGDYIFRVRASNNDGIWNEEGKSLVITVLPPFWKTKWAYFFYIVFIMGVLWVARKIVQERERINYTIEKERHEAQRLHELDMLKIKFFTNVSHEFRTPLTLIISPLEKLYHSLADIQQKNQVKIISRNAQRLLKLVNQLLDFRKLELDEFQLNPEKRDIIPFVREIVDSFSDVAEQNNIELSFHAVQERFELYFDPDKMEKILYNLLSNAFKFTPENKSVDVFVTRTTGSKEDTLEIKVSDTGIGIPEEMRNKIFQRYFKNTSTGSLVMQGSGIGLALTKEFVNLHHGNVKVESEPNKGSAFTISIPVKDWHEKQNKEDKPYYDMLSDDRSAVEEQEKELELNKNGSINNATILLVEDNEDFRFYLKDNLKGYYKIIEASNGEEGLKKTQSFLPDLIVSDVMMPKMDGIQLCEKIKTDSKTSHIPIILLSARVEDEQRIKGLEIGADDYVPKPFNFEILQYRIRNLIKLRESLKRNFNKKIEINPKEVSVTSLDEKLIKKALDLVEENLSNPDFSVEELSRELGMSRVHLYKKLSYLTGKSPIEFIRIIRLKRAAQLLEKSQLTVSEVAYKVGFNNPKYFSKYFKGEFNILPSDYIEQNRK